MYPTHISYIQNAFIIHVIKIKHINVNRYPIKNQMDLIKCNIQTSLSTCKLIYRTIL